MPSLSLGLFTDGTVTYNCLAGEKDPGSKGSCPMRHARRRTDYVYGGPGNDRDSNTVEGLWGGVDAAGDHVYGGAGNDYLKGGGYREKGVDRLFGGKGADVVGASQRMSPVPVGISREVIDCGPGTDTVYFDEGLDSVTNCEVRQAF